MKNYLGFDVTCVEALPDSKWFEDKLVFVVMANQIDEGALVKKTYLLFVIETKTMLTVHSQRTLYLVTT